MVDVYDAPPQEERSDEADLERFGYKQELRRTLGVFSSFAVAFSYISPSTGIFTLFFLGLTTIGQLQIKTPPIVAAGQLIVALGFALWGFYSREKRKRDNAEAHVQDTSVPALAVSHANGQSQSSNAIPGAFTVLIKAREDSWVSITADGKQLLEQVLVAPAEKSVEARNEIVIKAGSIGALEFSFNGKRLPVQGDYEEVKTLTFDVNGLHPTTPKPSSPTAQSLPPRG